MELNAIQSFIAPAGRNDGAKTAAWPPGSAPPTTDLVEGVASTEPNAPTQRLDSPQLDLEAKPTKAPDAEIPLIEALAASSGAGAFMQPCAPALVNASADWSQDSGQATRPKIEPTEAKPIPKQDVAPGERPKGIKIDGLQIDKPLQIEPLPGSKPKPIRIDDRELGKKPIETDRQPGERPKGLKIDQVDPKPVPLPIEPAPGAKPSKGIAIDGVEFGKPIPADNTTPGSKPQPSGAKPSPTHGAKPRGIRIDGLEVPIVTMPQSDPTTEKPKLSFDEESVWLEGGSIDPLPKPNGFSIPTHRAVREAGKFEQDLQIPVKALESATEESAPGAKLAKGEDPAVATSGETPDLPADPTAKPRVANRPQADVSKSLRTETQVEPKIIQASEPNLESKPGRVVQTVEDLRTTGADPIEPLGGSSWTGPVPGTIAIDQPSATSTPSSVAEPANARATPHPHQREIVRQVADRIEFLAAAKPRDGVTVHLKPLDLGAITVVVKAAGNVVHAELSASHESVKASLEDSRDALGIALVQRGYKLASLDVHSSTAASNDARGESQARDLGQALQREHQRSHQQAESSRQQRWSPSEGNRIAPESPIDTLRAPRGLEIWI